MTSNIDIVLNSLREIALEGFYDNLTTKFYGKLRFKLIDNGFPSSFAEDISTRVNVEISKGSITPEELDEMAEIFTTIIKKMFKAFEAKGFDDPYKAVINCAPRLSLKM